MYKILCEFKTHGLMFVCEYACDILHVIAVYSCLPFKNNQPVVILPADLF